MTVLKDAPESKFAYVVVAARRARQLMAGAPPIVDRPHSQKPTRIAMEELDQGVLEYDLAEIPQPDGDKGEKRRKG
ncbi:MAG TPA: DNA-directed RNA polymerase subunit omega [Candidatus Acidoferrales bacterium]|jgi:DNA-directed RNA polymerase subunit omega|nr:DNA-directed RNA polymerase subunit omega [Candidatus Acidoferrales bacterium]